MITKLDVINSCLGAIGENPVTNADSSHPSAIAARAVFDRVTKSIQSRGWWFNQEYRFTLIKNLAGEIILPSTTLKVDAVKEGRNYVQRGLRMYNARKHTFIIEHNLMVNIIIQLEIEDCPVSMADWIMKQCTYEFYRNDDGDADKTGDLKSEAFRAEIEAKKENLAASDLNAQNRPISLLMASRLRGPYGFYGIYNAGENPSIPGG